MAARLYHNNARVHFNQFAEAKGRFGKRIVYGGHVISVARALSWNGLPNAFRIAAINGGRHTNPVFAGDTIFAWSEVLSKAPMPNADRMIADRKIAARSGCVWSRRRTFPARFPLQGWRRIQ